MFNKKLHDTRICKGFTAQQMADSIGISIRAYRFYEAGTREPNISALIKIADTLDVSVDYLLERHSHEGSSDEH